MGSPDHLKYEKKYKPGAVRDFQRRRFGDGVSEVHVVYDAIQAMERESDPADSVSSPIGVGARGRRVRSGGLREIENPVLSTTNFLRATLTEEDKRFFSHQIRSSMAALSPFGPAELGETQEDTVYCAQDF